MTTPTSQFLPPLLALVSTVCSGLTSFGDAILFQGLWALCDVAGLIEHGAGSLSTALLFVTIMNVSNLPIALIVSRAHFWRCAPYGLAMATTGSCAVLLGSWLLVHAELGVLKSVVGFFFLVFSVTKLTMSVASWSKFRLSPRAAPPPREVIAHLPSSPPTGTVVVGAPRRTGNISSHRVDSAYPERAGGSLLSQPGISQVDSSALVPCSFPNSTITISDATGMSRTTTKHEGDFASIQCESTAADESSQPQAYPQQMCAAPVISPHSGSSDDDSIAKCNGRCSRCTVQPITTVLHIPATLGVFLTTGSLAGLLGGMYGTSGPPIMVIMSLLQADKEVIRATSSVYGLVTDVVRVVSVTASPGNVFDTSQWPVYAGVAVASWTGFLAGTYLRRWADTDTIVRVLLLLVFASAGILLGALTNASVAAGFAAGTAAWLVLLMLIFRFPLRAFALFAGIRASARACCPKRLPPPTVPEGGATA